MSLKRAIARFLRRGGEAIEPSEADVRRVGPADRPGTTAGPASPGREHTPATPASHPDAKELNREHRGY